MEGRERAVPTSCRLLKQGSCGYLGRLMAEVAVIPLRLGRLLRR